MPRTKETFHRGGERGCCLHCGFPRTPRSPQTFSGTAGRDRNGSVSAQEEKLYTVILTRDPLSVFYSLPFGKRL